MSGKLVMPAQAGIQRAKRKQYYLKHLQKFKSGEDSPRWIPAFAGITKEK